MLNDNQLLILLAVSLGLIILVKILERHLDKTAEPGVRALTSIQARLIVFGIIIIALWFSLPSSSNFQMLEYPKAFRSLDEVHAYLNEQSKSLYRLSEIIQTFFAFFFLIFLSDIYRLAKSILAVNVASKQDNKIK